MLYLTRRLTPFAVLVIVTCYVAPAVGCARRAASSKSAGAEAQNPRRESEPAAATRQPVDRPQARRAGGARPDVAQVERSIVIRTNDFRRSEGLPPVEADQTLARSARYFADFMARTGKYSHTADGKEPADRAAAHGYDYCIVLENIAYQYNSEGFETEALARGFVEGWKNSPGHRNNMLDADVSQTAAAVARGGETDYYYAVQLFGRPKSAAIVFEIANESEREVRYAVDDERFTLGPRYTRTHTRCRPPAMRVEGPGDDVLKPANGDRYVVRAGRGAAPEVTKR